MDDGHIDQAAIRGMTQQLAEDLGWLQGHARQQGGGPALAAELHLGAAMVRNVVAPFLEGQTPFPLHVAVVGGAGAGKSTVANMLSGAVLAESNPQAGFTRHPIAYTSVQQDLNWPGGLGFLGGLQRLSQPELASLDADVYQIRRLHPDPNEYSILDRFVVWDCPDMTTWAATGYVPRLLEVAGLADVLVYVASDERYNDEIPTQFLRLLLQAGKPVIVVVTKMREADAPTIVTHFQKDVLARMPRPAVTVLTIPHLTPEQRLDPVRQAPMYRVPLVNQVAVLGDPVPHTRRRSLMSAVTGLRARQQGLLGAARQDLDALQGWHRLVQQGQVEFDARYRREFLTNARFRRFDEALVRLLELLELPGVGRVLSSTLYVLRTPYRLVKGLFNRTLLRPEATGMPERRVLEDAMNGWLDLLRKEAATQSAAHPLWQHINKGFGAGLGDISHARFEEAVRGFQLGLNDEVERTARAIYEDLEKNPVALNTLRGTKFTLEITAIGATVAAGGLSVMDLVLVPIAASVAGFLVDLLGKQYVDRQREVTRLRQEAMVTQYVSGPMREWLTGWPTSGGSEYERLTLILTRFPQNLQRLESVVQHALTSVPT